MSPGRWLAPFFCHAVTGIVRMPGAFKGLVAWGECFGFMFPSGCNESEELLHWVSASGAAGDMNGAVSGCLILSDRLGGVRESRGGGLKNDAKEVALGPAGGPSPWEKELSWRGP